MGIVFHSDGKVGHDVGGAGECRIHAGLPVRKAPPFEDFDLGLVLAVFAELQLFSYVIVERRNVCRGDGRRLRIVLRLLAQGIKGGTGEAGIEAAGRRSFSSCRFFSNSPPLMRRLAFSI